MVHAIQSKWIFLQRVTWDTGDAFTGVDKIIQETFLPRLFFGKTKTLSPIVGDISKVLVNKDILRLLNPVTSAQEKDLISTQGSVELVRAMTREGAFSNSDHLRTLGEEISDRNKY